MSSKTQLPATITLADLQTMVVGVHKDAHKAYLIELHFGSAKSGRAWLAALSPRLSWGLSEQDKPSLSIAFTYQGLCALQLPSRELSQFSRAFAEGMAARAPRLGDPLPATQKETHALHALVILHGPVSKNEALFTQLLQEGAWARAPALGERAARGDLSELMAERERVVGQYLPKIHPDVFVRNVRALHRPILQEGKRILGVEYFGFRDGVSNPSLVSREGQPEHRQLLQDVASQFLLRDTVPLLEGGTFLVVRQLEQDVSAFWETLNEMPQVDSRVLAEQMVGRTIKGEKLEQAGGARCPFHAHAARVKPGLEKTKEGTGPLLIRRGLSYVDGARCGLMFMAINRDLETQFEFIQRNWIQRGNHVGTTSDTKDPIAGLAQTGDEQSSFTCTINGVASTVRFKPFVSLKWGDYLFLPARAGFQRLAAPLEREGMFEIEAELRGAAKPSLVGMTSQLWHKLTDKVAQRPRDELPTGFEAELKRATFDQIQRWMDDAKTAPLFWRAVLRQGGFRQGQRVFLAERAHVEGVLLDDGRLFSVAEYGRRIAPTLGPFFLGMDPHIPQYQREYGTVKIAEGGAVQAQQVQQLAEQAAELFLEQINTRIDLARLDDPKMPREISLEHMCAVVLNRVLGEWFGVSGPSDLALGSWGAALAQYFFRIGANADEAQQAKRAAWDYRRHMDGLVRRAFAFTDPEQQPVSVDAGELRRAQKLRSQIDLMSDKSELVLEDRIRNLVGIITGSLGATIKLFTEGMKHYDKTHGDAPMTAKALFPALIRAPLVKVQRGGPDALYRVYVGDGSHRVGNIHLQHGDEVVVWLGGNMELQPKEHADAMFGLGVHRCPARWMGIAIIEGMLQALNRRHGRVEERAGRVFFKMEEKIATTSA